MKNLENNIEETCIEFGEYLINNANKGIDNIDVMWEQFQEQQAKKVLDILDDIQSNDKSDDLEFGSTQDRINHEVLQLIADNNAVNDERNKDNLHIFKTIQDMLKVLDAKVNGNRDIIKLIDDGVKDIENDLYVNERFKFSDTIDNFEKRYVVRVS